VIRYIITPAKLRTAINAVDANWFAKAAAMLARLPDLPKSSDFKPALGQDQGVVASAAYRSPPPSVGRRYALHASQAYGSY
jgi:hypothetical protein